MDRRGTARLVRVLLLGGLPCAGGAAASAPPVPGPAPALAAAAAPPGREAELEARIRQLEAIVADGARREAAIEARLRQLEAAIAGGSAPASAPPPAPAAAPAVSAATAAPAAPPAPRVDMPPPTPSLPLDATFGPGFQLQTEDGEFQIQFHDLTHLDGRFYEQGGQDPVRDTFAFPRQWFIFNGHLTKPYEYFVAIAQGFDTLNLLDAFLNVRYDDRLQFRAGRFKTPYTYEFYALPIQGLIHPERSLFFNNFGVNRDVGLMLWGQDLFSQRLDYAVGIFNGRRNDFLDANDAKDVIAYLNVRPFGDREGSPLEHLHVGGSVDFGHQLNDPRPQTLRTVVPTLGNPAIGVPFLAFNPDVRESGDRALWSLHAAWYVEQLSLVAEWQSGFQNYAFAGAPRGRTRLPLDSFYVQAGYFLTGEVVTGRGTAQPLRPFDLRPGQRGPGAWELAGRYNLLTLGPEVFTAGLADPGLWSHRVYTTDLGLNWYWNQYLKVYLGWEHAEFGDPVQFAPGRRQLTSDLFWLRFQVFF